MNHLTDAGTEAGMPEDVRPDAGVSPANETTVSLDAAASATPTTNQPPDEPAPADFETFGLSEPLMRAIREAGYKTPTPIQAEGIPHAMKRRDLIGIAQTGTGKTASFALPMIELLSRGRAKARMPRSLILEPTRELAAQVAESFESFTKYNRLSMALLIGGVSFEEQDRKLDRGADILIATPGRLLDHFERGKLMMSQVQILVVDEADRMLDMGFIPDVERICKLIPFTRQTLFYSATMPGEIRRLTEQFLQNPVRIEVARPATTASTITQSLVEVPANDWAKREALRRLIRESGEVKNAIVFCNRKHDVDIVAKSLKKHEFNAAPLHGDLDQSLRMKTLEAFRSGDLQFLVASDVAARGLDIPEVSHVFNFDVPYHPDDYVHRVGRTGRAGRTGTAFMLVTPRDEKYVEAIEKLTGAKLERRSLEGLAEAVRERPERPERDGHGRGRGGRDRDRDRNRRDRHDRPIKPHGQIAAMEPVKPVAATAAPAPSPVAAPAQPPHRERRERDRERDRERAQRAWSEPVKPDISELPAFLLRPVPLPKPTVKKPVVKKAEVKKPVEKKSVADKIAAKKIETDKPVVAKADAAAPIAPADVPAKVVPVTETLATEIPTPPPAPPPAPEAKKPVRKRAAKKPAPKTADNAATEPDDKPAKAPKTKAAPAKKAPRKAKAKPAPEKPTPEAAQPAPDTPHAED